MIRCVDRRMAGKIAISRLLKRAKIQQYRRRRGGGSPSSHYATRTRPLSFDHFYDNDALTSLLHAWADERPRLARVESIGQSVEGRDIWLVTLTNVDTGPAVEKPAVLVEANMHSVEWTGSTAALHLIRHV